MKSREPKQWAGAALLAGFLVVFAHQGSFLGIQNAFSADSADLAGMAEVRDLIARRWVEEPKPNQLLNGAIRGMTATLDPFSDYISAEQRVQFEESTTGRFGGLGMWISIKDGLIVVISPIEDSPAWKAGILPGDTILRVDGETYEFKTAAEAVDQLKGEIGTVVELDVVHPGEKRSVLIKVARAQIQKHSVKGARLLDEARRIGYVRLTTFNSGTLDEFRQKIDELNELGMRGLIVDLRGNPGGFLDQAIKIANLWLPDDALIVRTWSREGNVSKDTVANGERSITQPTVLLIDGGSASASEVLAGALQDNEAAVLVGERTYGKGSVQTILSVLGDRAQIKLTTQYYMTPKDRRIHRGDKPKEDLSWGLIPQRKISLSQRERWRLSREESDRQMDRLKAKANHVNYEAAERLHLDDPQVRGGYLQLLQSLGDAVPEDVRKAEAAGAAPVRSASEGSSTAPVGTQGE